MSFAPLIAPSTSCASADPVSGFRARSQLHLKSCAVSGVPSLNLRSRRNKNVYVLPSGLTEYDSARSGTIGFETSPVIDVSRAYTSS